MIDVKYGMKIDDYINIIINNKFTKVYTDINEYIFYNYNNGVLVYISTDNDNIVLADYYFNWVPNNIYNSVNLVPHSLPSTESWNNNLTEIIDIKPLLTYEKKSLKDFDTFNDYMIYTFEKYIPDVLHVETENKLKHILYGRECARNNLISNLNRMETEGRLLTKWKYEPKYKLQTNKEVLSRINNSKEKLEKLEKKIQNNIILAE